VVVGILGEEREEARRKEERRGRGVSYTRM
jgi:hypothetical protein